MNKKTYIYLLVIFAFVLAVYGNTARNGFVFDDKFIVQKNPVIRSLDNIPEIFKSSYWPLEPGEPNKGLYRPLTILSYAVDYSIWKLNSSGYHIFNILSHAFNCILLFLVIRLLLGGKNGTALLTALIFAAHPVNTEAVSGIVGRADTMATSFILLGLLFYMRFNEGARPAAKPLKFYLLSLLFFFLGLLTKEIAITLPGVILLYDITFKDKKFNKAKIKYYAGYAAVAVVYFIMRLNVLGSMGPGATKQVLQTHTLFVRFFTVARVFASYLKLLFYPMNLYADYNSAFPYAISITEQGVIMSILLLLVFIALVIMAFRKRSIMFFALGWFIVTIFPVSQVIPIGAIMAERFLYLPGIGFAMFLGVALSRPAGGKKRVILALAALLILFMSARTMRRNLDWYSDYTLWDNTVQTIPSNGRAYYDLGTAALKEGKFDETIKAMEKCIELGGRITEDDRKRYALLPETYMHWVWLNLGLAYNNTGDVDRAIKAYKKTIELNPRYAAAYNNLGNAYLAKKMNSEALEAFSACIKINPNIPEGYYNLGLVFSGTGDYDKALEMFSKALKVRPDYADPWYAAGIVEYNKGNYARASELFKKALDLKPGFAAARTNYNISLQMMK